MEKDSEKWVVVASRKEWCDRVAGTRGLGRQAGNRQAAKTNYVQRRMMVVASGVTGNAKKDS
jgi:hypothetical protein